MDDKNDILLDYSRDPDLSLFRENVKDVKDLDTMYLFPGNYMIYIYIYICMYVYIYNMYIYVCIYICIYVYLRDLLLFITN